MESILYATLARKIIATRSLRLLAERTVQASPPPYTLFQIEAYDVIVTFVTSDYSL